MRDYIMFGCPDKSRRVVILSTGSDKCAIVFTTVILAALTFYVQSIDKISHLVPATVVDSMGSLAVMFLIVALATIATMSTIVVDQKRKELSLRSFFALIPNLTVSFSQVKMVLTEYESLILLEEDKDVYRTKLLCSYEDSPFVVSSSQIRGRANKLTVLLANLIGAKYIIDKQEKCQCELHSS